MNKKAQSGIGTLIIFISMLLVAAIAAGVLIQTTTSLQNKAINTGTQTREHISTSIQVFSMSATNGSDGSLESISILAKLAPGSGMINLKEVTTTLDTSDNTTDIPFADWTVKYLQNGTDHKDDYLVIGDVVKLTATLPNAIGENEEVDVRLIPKIGIQTNVKIRTPDIITKYNTHLYP